MLHPILDRRLLFVSGKGGVGKSVVAATIALLAFRRRRRVLVVELSTHGRIRELLGGPELGPEPVEIQPRLEAVRLSPRRALEDFLESMVPLRAVRSRLLSSHSFSILAAAAPGIEEFLVLAEIARLEGRRTALRRRPEYDLIVVDAPATGHSLPFLSTARTLVEILPVGPIARQSREVARLLADESRTAAVVVTLAEEMAVAETLEIAAGIARSEAIALGPVVVNALPPRRFDDAEAAWLEGASADARDPLVAAGRFELARRRRAEQHVARLRRELGVEPLSLPLATTAALDRPNLRRLVAALDEETAA